MSHTPEPWVAKEYLSPKSIGFIRAGKDWETRVVSGPTTKVEDAKRIVDCVNAMAGIDDPAWTVERMVGLIKVIADLDKHPQYNKTDDDSWYLAVMGSTGIKNESIREARVLLSRMGDA